MNKQNPIEWSGDLEDDCTAIWCGMMLRAEEMDRKNWWWAVYEKNGNIISSSNEESYSPLGGSEARKLAEQGARQHLAASRGVRVTYK
ncbi:MAG: hypothetical protein ACSHYA_06470 [Opitutaceae bacterium]